MSRIGKKPVALPKGVTASVEGQTVKVKGPKGERVDLHRPELCRPRRRDRNMAAARRAGRVQQVDQRHPRARTTTSRSRAARTKTDWEVELGVVIGTRRPLHREGRRAGARRRLLRRQRRLRARVPARARRRPVGQGQGLRHLRPDRPLARHRRRGARSAGAGPVARSRRPSLSRTATPRTMVFGVARLVSYLSRFMSLQPGDIISTGTPPGVGLGQKPPVYLRAGQTMRLGIEGLGEQRQTTGRKAPTP